MCTRRDERLRDDSVRFLDEQQDDLEGTRRKQSDGFLSRYITHRLPFATYGVAVYRFSTSAPRAPSLSPLVTTSTRHRLAFANVASRAFTSLVLSFS